jgi:hypothetical protein
MPRKEKHSMARKVLAILAFNVYALFLISAFQENTGYLFDASLIREMRLSGLDVNFREWGWGSHYIWRLFAGLVVTVLVSVLAGAIAKDGGHRVAALANIPSVLVWGGMIYLFGFAGVEVEARTGFIVISVIAIPLTTFIAYLSGGFGEEIQRQHFPEHSVLGIKGYHWIWAIFPLCLYGLGIVFVVLKFLGLQFLTWSDMSIVGAVISLLGLVPVIAWIYPLIFVYKVLKGEALSEKSTPVRALANAGLIVGGGIFATGVQFVCFWLLQKLMSWWY